MELAIGLLGAFIGAIAVVGAQLVSARTALRLEENKQLRADVSRATRSLLEALQAQQWLVWKAAFDSHSLADADVEHYEKTVQKGLGAITGDLGVLSATWPDVFLCYKPIASEIFKFDQEIAESIVDLRGDRAAGVERMGRSYDRILPYHWYVYQQVSRVVGGETAEEYDDWQPPAGSV